jgi:hypothetical protein
LLNEWKFSKKNPDNEAYVKYLDCKNTDIDFKNKILSLGWVEKKITFPMIKLTDDIFSVKKAQLFEYTFAHILDKGFESFFGFIHVLPGAWSAYRYNF